jgi:nucleoporin NDC1
LVSGITSSDSSFRYFAYSELQELAMEQSPAASARRTAFFADQRFNPTLWSHLCRTALLQLGNDYQVLLKKGQPSPLGRFAISELLKLILSNQFCLASAPTVTTSTSVSVKAPSTPLIRKQIFKGNSTSPVQSAINSLASDGYMAQAADAGASHIPELFRSVAPPVSAGVAEIKKAESGVMSWADSLRTKFIKFGANYLTQSSLQTLDRAAKWWSRDRIDKVLQRCLGNRQTDVLIVDCSCLVPLHPLDADHYHRRI